MSHSDSYVAQVMVSSTFTDLEEHRTALIKIIHGNELHANVMEHSAAGSGDLIESSLKMVRTSAAYLLIVSQKYGQTPKCPKHNPNELSITELEFNEAQAKGLPIVLFVMGDEHLVKPRDVESDPEKNKKLIAFRERAKKAAADSDVDRVYSTFESLEEFKEQAGLAVAKIHRLLDHPSFEPSPTPAARDFIPTPPAFYAEPDYIGSHKFVGRESQLQELNDWAKPADTTNLLLFEAIGGTGKSKLTWEWTTKHATLVRDDWAGRFWYSFYEKGAVMADFCRRALAYMTQRPFEEFQKQKTPELAKELVRQLHGRPWLLILDGLERVLVAYNRIDAAEVPDEEANAPTDKIARRDPCNAIREEDNELLRSLAAASPSKILISSRLTPRILLNKSGQPVDGAKRITLPGLRPADAELLLRSCEIKGDSAAIQRYLTTNCDNHPLVVGILAGLINDPGPNRGDFDAWAADPNGGAKLNLAELDLTQRRNHILRAALDALPPDSKQLLSTLALLSESVRYETLEAFNPHAPAKLEEVTEPESPEKHWRWKYWSKEERGEQRAQYKDAVARRRVYEQAETARKTSAEYRAAPKRLKETVADLELRGLLQFDAITRRYDLHPVVRGVAAGSMREEDRQRYGQVVVDHFSSQPHRPYDQAETLEDLRDGLQVIRTLLKLGQFQQAAVAYEGDLSNSLIYNLEAHAEALALLRPFFPGGWGELPKEVVSHASYLANDAAFVLGYLDEDSESLTAFGAALRSDLWEENWVALNAAIGNIASQSASQNLIAQEFRLNTLALNLASVSDNLEVLFSCRLDLFSAQTIGGHWGEAEAMWQLLDPMGRNWSRASYGRGYAEYWYATFQFRRGTLREEHLAVAERLARDGKNREIIRFLYRLRGRWRLELGDWASAAVNFHEAVRLARESQLSDVVSETGFAIAKFQLGELADPQREAERLAQAGQVSSRLLAILWQAVGDFEQARKHALAAYEFAWADGEPYVDRYALTKSAELLRQLNVPLPELPPYDSAKDEKFPWEDEVEAVIERLRAQKEAKAAAKQGEEKE